MIQLSGSIEDHRRELFKLVAPGANLEVRGVDFSLRELQAAASRLDGQQAWFRTIPAVLRSLGVDEVANRVIVEVSTVVRDVEVLIADRFDLHGLVKVESDGTGRLLIGAGTLRVIARDRNGRAVAGLECQPIADLGGLIGVPPITDAAGVCQVEVPATGYWVRLAQGRPRVVIAVGRVVVAANRTTEVVIETP